MKGPPKARMQAKVETQIYMKVDLLAIYYLTVHFCWEVSFQQHNEFQVSLSL